MVDAIPLVTEYNKGRLLGYKKNSVPDPQRLQMCLETQYCMALRISECLNLRLSDFNFERKILTLNDTKTGFKKVKGKKIRMKQFTSIPPDYHYFFSTTKDDLIFPFTRGLIWNYMKKASQMAKLDLGEQQRQRYINGAWTHLLRKSRSKMMKFLGASRELRMCKLRHTFEDAQDAYDVEDINALIKWESENIHG